MVISGVVDSTDCAVRLHQGVLPLHHVTIASFPLAFLIAGVTISDSIVELVAGVGLKNTVNIRLIVWNGKEDPTKKKDREET